MTVSPYPAKTTKKQTRKSKIEIWRIILKYYASAIKFDRNDDYSRIDPPETMRIEKSIRK